MSPEKNVTGKYVNKKCHRRKKSRATFCHYFYFIGKFSLWFDERVQRKTIPTHFRLRNKIRSQRSAHFKLALIKCHPKNARNAPRIPPDRILINNVVSSACRRKKAGGPRRAVWFHASNWCGGPLARLKYSLQPAKEHLRAFNGLIMTPETHTVVYNIYTHLIKN